MDKQIVVIANNIRSTHNVGSLLRTCDGLGVQTVYFCGYTPYPEHRNDMRLPHISKKLSDQIHKTALGAENSVPWEYDPDVQNVISHLKYKGYIIAGLEQSDKSIPLTTYETPSKIALVLGEEVSGLEQNIQDLCDVILEIPMSGKKESFNVAVACAIALYNFRFF